MIEHLVLWVVLINILERGKTPSKEKTTCQGRDPKWINVKSLIIIILSLKNIKTMKTMMKSQMSSM